MIKCIVSLLQTAYNLIQCEVASTVFPMIVGNVMESGVILHLWHSNPKLVVHGFLDLIKSDQGNMVTVLDLCQELKVKHEVCLVFVSFSCKISHFSLDSVPLESLIFSSSFSFPCFEF